LTVVDAQHPNAFRRRRLPTAVNIPADRVEALAPALLPDLEAPIVVYCGSWVCRTSDRVARGLRALGYLEVQVYRGGLADWRLAGLPLA
ncbi:MAG: rhodanese-like domain-containing protein, partial [Actinomycetota bacterium]